MRYDIEKNNSLSNFGNADFAEIISFGREPRHPTSELDDKRRRNSARVFVAACDTSTSEIQMFVARSVSAEREG